jgi:hypothetical protein
VKDVRPLVVACGHRSEILEPVDGPLDFIATSVDRLVEPRGPATLAAAALAVGSLVFRLGDRVFDLASAQVTPVSA